MENAKGLLAFLSVALVGAVAVALIVGGNASGSEGSRAVRPSPSAAKFAVDLAGVTNTAARGRARMRNVDCVQAAPGRYMCSYTLDRNGVSTCHLMQGRWTPNLPSAITVTLAGRTGRCRTVEEAIRTLR